jgi:hypothetical protein
MRILFWFLLALNAATATSQEALSKSEVIEVPGASADELFNRAYEWFASTYNNANEVLQIKDRDSYTLIGKALFSYEAPMLYGSDMVRGTISYTIEVKTKQGRYRYEIGDFIHDSYSDQYDVGLITDAPEPSNYPNMMKKWAIKIWMDMKAKSGNYSKDLMTALIAEMEKESELTPEEDDW